MSRNQPKPKIIFKTLDQIIKSSSLSKKSSYIQEELNVRPSALRSTTQISTHSLKKSTSKHSLNSKEKPPHRDSFQNSGEKQGCSLISFESLDSQIRKVYDQMQAYLHESKAKVVAELRAEQNDSKIQAKVRQLEKMSDYLKHIIDVFTNEKAQNVQIHQKKRLNSEKQNDCIERLSRNQKKKSSSRYMQTSSHKKPSIYQKILNHLY